MLSFALIFTDLIEDFVSIKFNQTTSSIKCSFHIQQENSLKSCSVVFGPGGNCRNLSQSRSGNSTTNSSVIVNLNIEQDSNDSELYCFHVTAANGTFTVVTKRIFNVSSIATNASSSVTVSCNLTALSYRTVLDPLSSNTVTCGVKSFSPLGIDNGIVCYNGTNVGSIAVYSCLSTSCHFTESSYETFIRMCKEDRKWSGTIPHCDCSESYIISLCYLSEYYT